MPTIVQPGITGTQTSSAIAAALTAARAQIGVPYVWGGESIAEGGFDCSGLVQYAFSQAGIKLPRVAADQQRVTTPVAADQARPGDLVFYGRPATHVGIYLGGGKMLAAPRAGDRVKIQAVYGTPTNYGRVVGSGTTGTAKEPDNPWLLAAKAGLAMQIPGLSPQQRADMLAKLATGDNPLAAAAEAANPLTGVVELAGNVGKAGAWMSDGHNWIRVAYTIVGGAMVLVGVAIIAKPAATTAAGTVASVVPAGRALKAVGKAA